MAKTDADPTTAASVAECGSFEQSLAELESIVHQLEDGQLSLADALAQGQKAAQLVLDEDLKQSRA